jgi:predicted MFS family arabinose efflux permease
MFKNYIKNYKGFPREIWILALITFINRAGTMVVPFLSNYLKEDLEFSYAQIGWVMVCFGVGSIVGTWLSGKLTDIFGFYKVMVFSLFASGLVFISLQNIRTFELFCFAIFMLTTIADMYRPAMMVSLNTYTAKDNRTRSLTLIRSAVNLGFLFGPAIGGFLIISAGYSYLFFIDAASCIAAILIFVIFVREKKLPFKLKKQNFIKDKHKVFNDKPFLLHLIVTMITGILFFQIFTTFPLFYKEKFILSEFECGLLLSFNGLLILLFELPIVSYVHRKGFNQLKLIILGISCMVVSFLMLLIDWNYILVFMMLFMSLGVMLTFPFASEFVMNRAHFKKGGLYMSVFTMSYSMAHIFSAKTGMLIIQYFGFETNWIFMSTLGVVGIFLGYRLLIISKREKTKKLQKLASAVFN